MGLNTSGIRTILSSTFSKNNIPECRSIYTPEECVVVKMLWCNTSRLIIKQKKTSIMSYWSNKIFTKLDHHCYLDLLHNVFTFNSCHHLAKSNIPLRFHKCKLILTPDALNSLMSLWPWPLTYWPQNQSSFLLGMKT
jgi:hypothetical protein